MFDPSCAYRLHPKVALRPEPFGALAYHYGNRKLVFLRSPRLLALVRQLDAQPSVNVALDSLALGDKARTKYLDALASLNRSDMLVLAATNAPPPNTAPKET